MFLLHEELLSPYCWN